MERNKKKMQTRIITLALLTPLVVAMLLSLIYVMASLSTAEAEDPAQAVAEMEQAFATPATTPDCDFADWVGATVIEETVRETGRPYRIVQPGQPMTMDYNAERINVLTDDEGMVLEVNCG